MRAYDVIKRKRDGHALHADEIRFLVDGYVAGSVADYQMAAFAMATFFRGATADETRALTEAMLHSGVVVDLSHVPGKKVDKHSTGGVGDKISLPLAPAVSALGVAVPMVSGRGLGHTGGTLDKLESIPGFRVAMPLEEYRAIVARVGCCLIGQTREIAPADKQLYALRDVTATVECIPLITSSILSKKLAEGIDALVLDVKTGSGAFMKTTEDAVRLARTLVDVCTLLGKPAVALLTDMSQPLGAAVGNTLEVEETLDVLDGGGPADVVALTVELGAEMLVLGGRARDLADGRTSMRAVLADGRAKAQLVRIIEAQGGDARVVDDRARLPHTKKTRVVTAARAGFVRAIDAEAIGTASMLLGGGRRRAEDKIDPRVGVRVHARLGDPIAVGAPLATLFVADAADDDARALIARAFTIDDVRAAAPPLLGARIAPGAP